MTNNTIFAKKEYYPCQHGRICRLSEVLILGACSILLLPYILLLDGGNLIDVKLKYGLFFVLTSFAIITSQSANESPKKIFIPLSLFVLFGLMSTLWSDNLQVSMERSFFNILMVFMMWLIIKKFKPSSLINVIYTFGFIVSIIVLVGSLLAYFIELDMAYDRGNFRGVFYNSNALGHLIGGIAIPYLLVSMLVKSKLRYVNIVVLGLLIFILLESHSRAGVLAAVVSSVYILYSARLSLSKITYFLLFIISLSTALYVIKNPWFFVSKWESVGVYSPFATRMHFWVAHLDAINQRPLLGYGIGVNPVDLKKRRSNKNIDTEKGSSLITLPEEIGVPLALIVLITLLPLARKLKNQILKDIRGSPYLIDLLPKSIILGGLAHALFESWLFYFGNPVSFMFWLSCIYIALTKYEERETYLAGSVR